MGLSPKSDGTGERMDDLGGVEGCSDIAVCAEGLPSLSGEDTASSSGSKPEWRLAAAEASVKKVTVSSARLMH